MELSRIEDAVVTDTSLPARNGVYAESRGSALWRTGRISGLEPETKLFALFFSKRWRWWENSDSMFRAGWTDKTKSLARYAILATGERTMSAYASRNAWGSFTCFGGARNRTHLKNCEAVREDKMGTEEDREPPSSSTSMGKRITAKRDGMKMS